MQHDGDQRAQKEMRALVDKKLSKVSHALKEPSNGQNPKPTAHTKVATTFHVHLGGEKSYRAIDFTKLQATS
jgi:hypothetical protein